MPSEAELCAPGPAGCAVFTLPRCWGRTGGLRRDQQRQPAGRAAHAARESGERVVLCRSRCALTLCAHIQSASARSRPPYLVQLASVWQRVLRGYAYSRHLLHAVAPQRLIFWLGDAKGGNAGSPKDCLPALGSVLVHRLPSSAAGCRLCGGEGGPEGGQGK